MSAREPKSDAKFFELVKVPSFRQLWKTMDQATKFRAKDQQAPSKSHNQQ
jgi:hypothetical protein